MILTITLNPSMDYVYHRDTFKLGKHNRFNNPQKMPGGKGINAARALSMLGENVLCFTTLAGLNGKLIEHELKKDIFKVINHSIYGESRNAITIIHDNNMQTEIVEAGPVIDSNTKFQIFDEIIKIINHNNIQLITINGSVNTSEPDFYLQLITHIRAYNKEIKILMDISGVQLSSVTKSNSYYPYFIKPNIQEFADLTGIPIQSKQDIIENLKTLDFPIELILVSCGSEGGVAKCNNYFFDISIPKINVVNPTGSGDSTVAGIAYALNKNFDIITILKYGMAAGMANATEKGVGVVNSNKVMEYINKIKIDLIS